MRSAAPVLLFLAACITRGPDSPLTLAARSGNAAEVRALIAGGSDPNVRDGGNDWSPLMHAVHKNQLGTAAALLDGGAKADFGAPDGFTPLMMAAAYDNREMVALLLARGASSRLRNAKGDTALDFAITGANDIDRFTPFRCNDETARMLTRISPPANRSTKRWANIKGC